MKSTFLLLFVLFNCSVSFCQKEGNIWCFGNNAGLDFNSGSPVPFTGVAMTQLEGCASIADSTGSLLFYTDGITVWNSSHTPMPNGTGLSGNLTSTQSAMIVKQPGTSGIYYLFTTGYNGAASYYNIIDMSLQSGSGDVTQSNVQMSAHADEKITAVRHANGTDIWVIMTENLGGIFHSFLLTSSGMITSPVTTVSGITHSGNDYMGCLKSSPLKNKLAMALHETSFELHDFDNATGITSNPIVMSSSNYGWSYGVEFSPDGSRLYASVYGPGYNVYQFDLTLGTATAIINSATLIGTSTNYACTLQLGPDQKIYMASYSSYLSAINFPNQLGIACNFVDTAVNLSPGASQMGLPNVFVDFVTTTGVNEALKPADGFIIYPNPAPGNAIVTFNSKIKSDVHIGMFDTLGKLVYNQQRESRVGENRFEIVTDKFKPGIYFLRLKNEGKEISEKIILK